MQVTKNITLDLLETCSPVIIKAKQNDRNTRYIAAHLYVDGLDYPVPSGTEIALRFKKPDGTAGFYDALPDNSPAITVSGNTVTVELVEQVLTVAGCVHCEINMYNAASEKLTTFTFEIAVEESVLTDAEIISSDYYNLLTSEIAKALQAVTGATEQAENAAQSAQEAADSAAMSKDWAAGQPVTYSGTPVSIAYAGAQRIASITAYGENAQGGTTEAPVALTGISSVTVNEDVTELPIPRPLRKVGDVRDVCRTRVKSVYDKRIVLDGTENWNISSSKPNSFLTPVSERIVNGLSDSYPTLKSPEIGTKNGIYLNYTADIIVTDLACSTVEEFKAHLSAHPLTVYYRSTAYDGTNGLDVCLTEYQTGYIESYADESITTAWISSTGELSTGAEVAYVLSSPETYATEPLDFDNAAGPLTVMTGGELEVRMTELVGSRSPEIVAKMDKAVYAQVGNPNLLDNSDFMNPVNQRGEGAYYANGYIIDRWVNNGSAYNVAEHYMASGSPDGTKYIFQPLEFSKVAKAGDTLTASANINGETISVTAEITAAKGASDVVTALDGKASIGFSWNPADDRIYFRINDLIESGAVFLNWAKLEKGSVATPYVPKGYGAELAECLRYLRRYRLDWQMNVGSGTTLLPLAFSKMRTTPTASFIGSPYAFNCTQTGFTLEPYGGAVNLNVTTSGVTDFQANILISAEL